MRFNIRLLLAVPFFLTAGLAYANNPKTLEDFCAEAENKNSPKCATLDDCNKDGPSNGSLVYRATVGNIPFEPDLAYGRLVLHRVRPTPTIFSTQAFVYESLLAVRLSGYEYKGTYFTKPEIDPNTHSVENVQYWRLDGLRLWVANELGVRVEYYVPAGSSQALPISGYASEHGALALLGSNGAPYQLLATEIRKPGSNYIHNPYLSTGHPAGVRFHRSNGSSLLLWWIPSGLKYTSASGRTVDTSQLAPEASVHLLRTQDVLRQVKTPQALADLVQVAPQVAEVRFYTPADIGSLSGGIYSLVAGAIPYRRIRVENATADPARFDQVRITEFWGTRADISTFVFNEALDKWILQRGAGADQVVENKTSTPGPTANQETITRTLSDAAGAVVSTVQEVTQKFSWGNGLLTRIKEPATLNLTTTFTYHSNGREASVENPDGSWTRTLYTTGARPSEIITPWKDAAFSTATTGPRVIKHRAYVSLMSGDTVGIWDTRPRTKTESVVMVAGGLPVVTERVWHVYKTDPSTGVYTEIEEQAAKANADFGEEGNLRTTRVYHTPKPEQPGYDAESAGRLHYEDRPDGTRTTYGYSRNPADLNAYFTVTEVEATSAYPGGLNGLSTRAEKIYDVRGHLLETRSYIRSGTQWHLVSTAIRTVDAQGFHLATHVDGRQTYAAAYDAKLLVSRTTDDGVTTTCTYDALGKVDSETRQGVAASGTYAAQPDVTTTYLRELGGLDCGCDGELTAITSAGTLSLESKTKKDATGRLTYQKDAAGLETFYAYALGGRQTTRTNPDGGTYIDLHYLDGRHKSHTGTSAVAEYFDYGVNSDGTTWEKMSKVADTGDRWQKTTANHLGQIIKQEQPAYDGGLLTTTYTYNTKGQLVRQRQRHISGSTETTLLADTLNEYDALGNMSRTGLDVNANGTLDLASADRVTDIVTTVAYHESAWWKVQQTKVYPTLDSAAAVQFSETRQRLSGLTGALAAETVKVDVDGNITRQTRQVDFAARLVTTTMTHFDSALSAVSLNRNGLIISETSKTIAGPALYGYDALGRRTSAQEARHAQASTYVYSATTGQLASHSDAAGHATTYQYYPQGQVGAGKTKLVTNALGHTQRFAYDLHGRLVHKWGTADYPQSYTYTPHGELHALATWRDTASANLDAAIWPAPAGSDVTTWIYQTSTGLLTRKQYSDAKGTDYTYDKLNRLATRTWARTSVLPTPGSLLTTTYSYVPTTGEVASVDYSDSTPDVVTTHDRLGRQATITDATGTRTFAYDSAKLRLSTETLPAFFGHRVLTRGYQGSGGGQIPGRTAGYQLGSAAQPAQDFSVSYGYDITGRINRAASAAGAFDYTYVDNSDLRFTITGPAHVATTAYEPQRDVIDYVENKVGSTTVSKYDYTVNAIGQRSARAQSGTAFAQTSTDSFGYNSNGEVTSSTNSAVTARNQGFAYDQIGNRLTFSTNSGTTSYTSNSLNQYTQVSGFSAPPSYDHDGNQLTTGLGQAYVWDAENRLISVEPLVPAANSLKVVNVYDSYSRRVRRTIFTFVNSTWVPSNDEKYIYEGWNVVAVYDASSALTLLRAYTWGVDLSGSRQGAGGVGGLLAVSEISNGQVSSSYHYAYDANGNVGQLLSNAAALVAHYEYDAFGGATFTSGNYAGQNEYRFSTKPLDAASGLYYYGFRYYNPSTGRWPNRDPIGEYGGLNLYGMVENDAISNIDLLGLNIGGDSVTCAVNRCLALPVSQSITCLSNLLGGQGKDDLVEAALKAQKKLLDLAKNAKKLSEKALKEAWDDVHAEKKILKKQFEEQLKKLGDTNFDVWLDKMGNIWLKGNQSGEMIYTGIPL